ncbi:MAG: hypothetical protein NZX77_21070 [Polyangiaceae bacterium]|nr:hypothetical protein [Polyangiaceae bacterium]
MFSSYSSRIFVTSYTPALSSLPSFTRQLVERLAARSLLPLMAQIMRRLLAPSVLAPLFEAHRGAQYEHKHPRRQPSGGHRTPDRAAAGVRRRAVTDREPRRLRPRPRPTDALGWGSGRGRHRDRAAQRPRQDKRSDALEATLCEEPVEVVGEEGEKLMMRRVLVVLKTATKHGEHSASAWPWWRTSCSPWSRERCGRSTG